MAEDQQQPARKSDRYSGQGGSGPRRSGGFKSGGPKRDGGNRGGGFRGRDERERDDRRPRGDGERKPFRSPRSGDSQGRREGYGRREGGFKSRRHDRDERRSQREGDFKPRREGVFKKRDNDFNPRRDGSRDERHPRRDGEFKPRRNGEFKPRRDGDRVDRGPRRSFRDEDRGAKKRPMRHRSGGQFRRRDDVETPIQTSLTGSPMPIRVDTKPVVDVPRPWFPDKEEWPEVPRRLLMEIESTARESEIKEVAVAVMIGTAAFEQGDLDRALEFFSWAKTRAARSITIREGLGICYYVAGEFEQAQRELQTFARISGRAEHNHILADCSRATGNGERVPELINQMVDAWKKEPEFFDLMNLIEGLIVLAGYWLEDRNQPEQALAAINMVALPEDAEITESHLRLWHVQARAAEAAGDKALAKAALDEIKAVNPEWLVAMNKWIDGEDIDEFFQPWATEIPAPEEPEADDLADPESADEGRPDEDEDGDILPDTIPEHLQAKADLARGEDGEESIGDLDNDEDDDSWDPGDDWEDEDWDEEDPEPGIPIETISAHEETATGAQPSTDGDPGRPVSEDLDRAEPSDTEAEPPRTAITEPSANEASDHVAPVEQAADESDGVHGEPEGSTIGDHEAAADTVREEVRAADDDVQPGLFDDES